MRSHTRASAVLVLTGLIVLSAASAARSETESSSAWGQERGFDLGLQFLTSIIGAKDPGPNSNTNQLFVDEVGGGLMLNIGYTFTPHFAMRLSAGGGAHETTQQEVEAYVTSFALEAHYRFMPEERARPYLLAGLGGTTLGFTTGAFEAEARGGSAMLGMGMLYSLTQHFVFDFTARLDLINWNEIVLTQNLADGSSVELEQPVDDSGSAGKILFGFAWQF